MTEQSHIIGKQHLKITLGDRDRAYDTQTRVLEVFKSQVLPRMQSWFDDLVDPEEVIRIDRLQLDLGGIDLTNLEEDLARKLETQLRDAFFRMRSGGQGPDLPKLVVEPASFSKIALLEHFLQYGILPWSGINGRVSIKEVAEELIAREPRALRKMLLDLAPEFAVRRRIALTFSEEVVGQMLAALQAHWAQSLPQLRRETKRLVEVFPLVAVPLSAAQRRDLLQFGVALAVASQTNLRLPEVAQLSTAQLRQVAQGTPSALRAAAFAAGLWLAEREVVGAEALARRIADWPVPKLAAFPERLTSELGEAETAWAAVRSVLARMLRRAEMRREMANALSAEQLRALLAAFDRGWSQILPRLSEEVGRFLNEYPLVAVPLAARTEKLMFRFFLALAVAEETGTVPVELTGLAPELLRHLRAGAPSARSTVALVLARFFVAEAGPAQPDALAQRLEKWPVARLAELPARLATVSGAAETANSALWRTLLGDWAGAESLPKLSATERKAIIARVLAGKLVRGEAVAERKWLVASLRALVQYTNAEARGMTDAVPNPATGAASGGPVGNWTVEKLLRALENSRSTGNVAAALPAVLKLLAMREELRDQAEKSAPQHPASSANAGKKEDNLSTQERLWPRRPVEEAYINNAGLVLLNPFFSGLFDRLGWLEAGQFVNSERQGHAALLLQYLATGEREVEEEYTLALNKLLVGLPVEAPVDLAWRPDAETRKRADLVLASAIHNWPKIGKIDHQELRQGFICREGKMTASGANWQLKIERGPYDVLLEFIPWSYGIVRLSWMEAMIAVDW
ncbi:MAG: contractile injection system tape measure protein [Bacteroidota bacterium]